MAKSKSKGRKQNTTGKQPTRRSAKNAVRDPVKKKALSAKAGKTKKPKGPAAKKPATAKGSATMAKRNPPRKSKPMAKGGAKKGPTKGAMKAKKPAGRKTGRAAKGASAAKAGAARKTQAPRAINSPASEQTQTTTAPVSMETVPPPQASGGMEEDTSGESRGGQVGAGDQDDTEQFISEGVSSEQQSDQQSDEEMEDEEEASPT